MRTLLIATLLASLTACSYLTPYKLDVPQGNAVTADQVAKLKLGMTRAQVRFALGTPLLVDAFHPNRWDYLYYDSKGGKVEQNKRYHVLFDGDRVIGMGGDTLPARASVADKAPKDPRATAAPEAAAPVAK
ncbi:outer membrane protein assembly factor BamE [Chitinimonas sp. JJ19]|uniref:outer membrane protein assembly factor BamE n=1 Tax=Chitinimonas sp. JJ19 TaxID=3109352 RepID=UPI002FFEB4D8